MGKTHWGLGIRLVSMICIFIVMMAHKCAGDRNLTKASCSKKERLTLLEFKHSIRDDGGLLSSWGVGNDCCRWERVGCDDATGSVVSLHLRANVKGNHYLADKYTNLVLEDYNGILTGADHYLVGEKVNACLTELVNLEFLDLSGNYFLQSRIPEFIGSFKQLRYLNLSGVGFSGNIPHQIGNLSKLKVLDLSSARDLTTNDTTWISGLSKLKYLNLGGVDLSRTQNLDSLLYRIPSLSKLILSKCRLRKAHLGSHHLNSSRELASIKHLDLSGNGFTSEVQSLFLNLTSLEFLDLSWNDLSLAWRFENLLNMIPSISELRLSFCGLQKVNFSPTNLNFSTYSNIRHLDLSSNEIEAKFPYVLANMSSLLSLDMSGNMLNSSIHAMPNLLKLDISGNNLWRIEDVGIWRQCRLKELIVSGNVLEGEMIGRTTNVSKCSQNALEILDLDDNALKGSIPESLGRLTNLRGLDLSFNELTGPIPEALGKLRSLQELYLSQNYLTDTIPKFHGKLTILHLAYNQFRGSIPESLGRLTTLTEIFLKSNRFTGSIPVSLGRLTSLRVLSLSSNLLNGTIPNSIGQLKKLYILDVSNNSLQGAVSKDHFATLSTLKYLNANYNNKLLIHISREWIPPFQLKVVRLSSCQIKDGFPQWFQTQRRLEEVLLSNASLSGPLPAWLRLTPIMHVLDLSHNKLTGPLTNLPFAYKVRYSGGKLLLQDNLFRGFIPRRLCKRTDLEVLDLSENRLTGKIPKCLWNMSLQKMLLSSNRLSGVIPGPSVYSSLLWLQLNDNNFNGELPQDFGYFINLVALDLGENKISGNIPEWIGEKFSRLNALRLHKNNFTGRIPHSLCKAKWLQILDLAHNNLKGPIPHCLGELDGMTKNVYTDSMSKDYEYVNMKQVLKGVALEYTKTLEFVKNLDLSSNKLVGEIPKALMALNALVGLNLCNNRLSGNIPKNIGNMNSLNSLDLSANKLNGGIPPSMASLNFLSYLNLSHNNLSGQIPTGNQLQTLTDPSMYAYNTYLCGAPLPKECSPHENPPTTTSNDKYKNSNDPKKVWFYLDITCGFATGFWGITGVLHFKKQWRQKLFMFCEKTMDKIYVAVAVKVLKMKRGREAP